MKNLKVVHLTSVHGRRDPRIFAKECASLAKAGCDVYLIVADGKGCEERDGVKILDVGRPKGRSDRMVNVTRRMIKRAVEIDGDVFHLHDPELVPGGLLLKRNGKRVVFDSHEDIPRDMLSKEYLPRASRKIVSWLAEMGQRLFFRRLDGVVAATPTIRDKILPFNSQTIDVKNFPIIAELTSEERRTVDVRLQVVYVGGLSRARGVRELVRAMGLVTCGARLCLAGEFSDVEPELEEVVKRETGWERVDAVGFLDRERVRTVLAESVAGMVTLHPTPAFVEALPVKMFEYMCAGIPVIASNFPIWREIIEGNQCGICVNPLEPQEIACAIDYLVVNREEAERMGRNGRRAVRDKYNWAFEERRLIKFYQDIMK